ncbi:hypothetical protein FRX31_032919 [Thalictrum thalictroides]|uniref:Uncharacterized protein n=1 Tax=Thalictrum thalictroides TaxID=46969 RepID=A0A7J6UXZ6_THATH|nr:hypothetical protein FRX31_032919 [Thalictrum thalictroides]
MFLGGTKVPPFAEYYDSISNQWYLLPDPPFSFSHHSCILYYGAAVHGEDTIIIWNSSYFCLLDLSSLPPKWHFINGPRLSGTYDFVSNNTAVVKGIVYWSARDLFAFDLASNKRFAKPAFKFDESDSAIAPSIEFLRSTGTLPPILVATGDDQLSVIWFVEKQKEDKHLKVYLRKFQIQTSDDAEKGMLADCRKFQIQTSDDLEKEMPLHKDHDRSETIEFRIDGKQIYKCAAVCRGLLKP